MSSEPKIGGREPVLVELVARRDLLVAPLRPLAEPASRSQPFYPHPHPLPTRGGESSASRASGLGNSDA